MAEKAADADMKEKVGEVFSIARDYAPVPGCTISKEVHGGENDITYFSLARNTDISAEIYPYHKLLILVDGSMEVYGTVVKVFNIARADKNEVMTEVFKSRAIAVGSPTVSNSYLSSMAGWPEFLLW